MVVASWPVVSFRRLAARPVGAQSDSFTLFAARIRRTALRMVVLPTPGPPVITRTLDASARRTAAFWLGASSRRIRCSIQGNALSTSIESQGKVARESASSRAAIACSAR